MLIFKYDKGIIAGNMRKRVWVSGETSYISY